MAQTQTPDELRQPKAQTKKTQSTPDKLRSRSSGAQQNGKGRRGIAKKETPNYMKSTTCSDARKDPMQVSAQSPAPATVVKAKNHADQSNSKPSPSSSPSLPVAKHLKTLARKASLRPRRPSMKKIYETSVLSPRRKVSRATCSSTMKESKFPNVSEVNPGNEVAALTSAVKVCPFNYCSLHGRRHQHLQPLRRLPSARRRSFRTQRSVKLRRVSSIRRRSFKKGGRSMNSSKMRSIQGSKIAPVIEETNYDFLNEIYKDEFDREISKFLESLEPSGDDTEFSEEEIEEFEGEGIYIEIPEQHGLEESKSAIGDGSHTSKGHSFVAENGGGDDADHGDDKHEETDESGSDELEEKNISSESQTIEQVVEDDSTSEQNRSVVADDQGSESSNVYHSNKSEQDGFGKAKLGTDDEDDDNSNISNGGEDDRTEGRNAERSKLAAAEEWPENKEPEITSGYENPDSSLKLTEEEKVRDGRFIENQGFWDSVQLHRSK
ncbi:uncharacterized protein LOC141819468 isoform X2 [Curcuma longa]|uniref:uncharacterized protein LOC141819468 isoform X2 n=1 Tax=Curcuma longa TaxID=136217 RepID=UPI003D9E1617